MRGGKNLERDKGGQTQAEQWGQRKVVEKERKNDIERGQQGASGN